MGGIIGGLLTLILIGVGAHKFIKWWKRRSPQTLAELTPVDWDAAVRPRPMQYSSVSQDGQMVQNTQ
jgi:hypothetical protein